MSRNSGLGELETYLQGETDLSRLYADLPQVELPDHLDAAILAEAHRAVASRPAARPKRRWAIPLSMAASLIVAVMVGLQLPYMLKEASLTQPQQEEKTAVAAMDKIAEPVAPAPEERREIQPMARAKSASVNAAPAPARVKAADKPKAPAPAASQESEPSRESAASGESAAAKAEHFSAAPMAAPVAAPVAAPPQAPARSAQRLELQERADAEKAPSKRASSHAESELSDSLEQRAPAAAGMAAPQPAEPGLSPEDWLVRIQRLKQQGKMDEAKKELAAFRKRYPEYRVPEAFEVR